MSKKILELARDQRDEVAEELGEEGWEDADDDEEDEDVGESSVVLGISRR
jgi:hypothetical protein